MLLHRMFPFEEGKWSEEEIRQQEQKLIFHNHKKPVKQKIPKVYDKKKIIFDLFCLHLKLVRKGDYVVCTKCGEKWKAKNKSNKGTIK